MADATIVTFIHHGSAGMAKARILTFALTNEVRSDRERVAAALGIAEFDEAEHDHDDCGVASEGLAFDVEALIAAEVGTPGFVNGHDLGETLAKAIAEAGETALRLQAQRRVVHAFVSVC